MINKYKKELSIIIPTYNEEIIIKESIKKIHAALSKHGFNFEIIITDDGSLDNTKQIIKELRKEKENLKLISLEKNKGRGWALKNGFKFAEGNIQLTLDADIPFELETIVKIIHFIEDGNKIVIGSKHLKDSKVEYPFLRRILSIIYSNFTNKVGGGKIYDYQCGLKAFDKHTINRLIPKTNNTGWSWDTELLLLAQNEGIEIKEVPVTVRNIFKRESKVNLMSDSFIMGFDLIRLWWRFRKR